jgi:DNA-directed RNA polymerase subunit K/omega
MNEFKDDLDFERISEEDDDLTFEEQPPAADGAPEKKRRSPELDRKIRTAVETMLEAVENPYEAVIVASQEARRINGRRLKARSILNQAMEQIDEIVPEVPFMPKPVEDDEPEVKPTNEALERLALGNVTYEINGDVQTPPSFSPGLQLQKNASGETKGS